MKKLSVYSLCVLCVTLSACSTSQKVSVQDNQGERAEVMPVVKAQHIVTSKPPASFLSDAPVASAAEAGETFVTVYNDNLALVKEMRQIELKEGVNEIRYAGVPDQIDPTSVTFLDRDNPENAVIEQNYRYDLISQQELLKQYVDKDISITVQEGDNSKTVEGKLLSFNDGVVLQTQNGIEAFKNLLGFSLPSVEDLITKPTLIWLIQSAASGMRNTETSYLTRGMDWHANYIAVVNEDDTSLGLKGWTTINNNSGKDYPSAQLQLVAGSVNRVQKSTPTMMRMEYASDMAVAESSPGFAEEGLFEYHLYTLGRKTEVKNKSQKQIELLSAKDVNAEKHLEFDPQKSGSKVRAIMKLKNDEESGLGMPLPAGVLRAFKSDSSGQLQFIGEDSIDHTPKNKEFEVFLGNVFDISVERKTMESSRIPNPLVGNRGQSQTMEVTFVSGKDEDVTVTIVEHLWGKDAKVSGIDARKIDANTFEIDVKVPAGEEVSVKYDTSWYY